MISVITINLNNVSGLKKTMNSVFNQTKLDFEYIVIDGGSTDGSKEFIVECEKDLDFWLSERDNGVYYAMNKGIKHSSGKYILFLNSGDFFADANSLTELSKEIGNADIIYGDLIINEKGRLWRKVFPDELTFKFFLRDSLPHPATLINRRLFGVAGMYNENLKVVSDWEFFMKVICVLNCNYKHIDKAIAEFQFDGLSSGVNEKQILTERHLVLQKNYKLFLDDYEEAEKVRNRFLRLQNSRWMRLRKVLNRVGI